jgi:hypothetical protein
MVHTWEWDPYKYHNYAFLFNYERFYVTYKYTFGPYLEVK